MLFPENLLASDEKTKIHEQSNTHKTGMQKEQT